MQIIPAISDPIADGLSLLQDYDFGFNPLGPPAIAPVTITAESGNTFLNVIRATPTLDLIATVMISENLRDWQPSPLAPLSPTVLPDSRFLGRYPLPLAASTGFFRLRLER